MLNLTHCPTALPGADPETDRTIFCAGHAIGRVRRVDAGPQAGAWHWSGLWISETAKFGVDDSLVDALAALKTVVPADVIDRLPGPRR